jgi:hypothetical protein
MDGGVRCGGMCVCGEEGEGVWAVWRLLGVCVWGGGGEGGIGARVGFLPPPCLHTACSPECSLVGNGRADILNLCTPSTHFWRHVEPPTPPLCAAGSVDLAYLVSPAWSVTPQGLTLTVFGIPDGDNGDGDQWATVTCDATVSGGPYQWAYLPASVAVLNRWVAPSAPWEGGTVYVRSG